MRGDIFAPHSRQRIGVAAVPLVAHQRAHIALRVVILGLAKAVIYPQHGAALQAFGQGADKAFGLRVDFREVIVAAFYGQRRA